MEPLKPADHVKFVELLEKNFEHLQPSETFKNLLETFKKLQNLQKPSKPSETFKTFKNFQEP